jgi:3-oxoacyl-[acyl-carrier-protein] synthase II
MSVVITGIGAVSAVGPTRGALWEALAAGIDGIRPIERFRIDGIASPLGALVPGYETPRAEPLAHRGLSIEFAIAAAREALQHAGVHAVQPARIALVLGTSIGDDLYEATPLDVVTARVADALAIAGPRITVSTACTSSTNAIGLAADLLADGHADLVIAGGTDVLTPEIYAGFHGVGVLSSTKCAPFSEPFGTTLGEGAGFVVLERADDARSRGATAYAAVCGYGLAADAFHETSPDPTGAGVARAITSALANAGVAATDIDYINAHGTGTEANDPAEWRAIVRVFGEHAERLPVSSTKGMLGHAQGAAGVLELITTVLAMREGVIPPTLNFTRPRANAPRDPVGSRLPRAGRLTRSVCTSAAFGGANAAVVVGDPALAATPTEQRRPVYVLGVANVGSQVSLEKLVPTASPRGLNPTTRYLTAAAALALEDAGLRLRKHERERAGLFVGTTEVSPQTAAEFRASIAQRGFAQLSAAAFARMVVNAATGACTKLLGCKGPTTTLTTGDGSGLVALVYAARWLAHRRDADVLLAAGVDEVDRLRTPSGSAARPGRAGACDRSKPVDGRTDGAACVVLGTAGTIRIAGWSIGAPGAFAETCEHARAMAELDDVDATYGDASHNGAAGSVVTFVDAVTALRRGEHRRVLVGHATGGATCALVLTMESPHGC